MGNSVIVCWGAVPGADSYYLFRSADPNGPYEFVYHSYSTAYYDGCVLDYDDQVYYIIATSQHGGDDWDGDAYSYPVGAPDDTPPSGLEWVPGGNTLTPCLASVAGFKYEPGWTWADYGLRAYFYYGGDEDDVYSNGQPQPFDGIDHSWYNIWTPDTPSPGTTTPYCLLCDDEIPPSWWVSDEWGNTYYVDGTGQDQDYWNLQTTVNLVNVTFVPPEIVPHNAAQAGGGGIALGCEIDPPLAAGSVQSFTLMVYDPANPGYYSQWPGSSGVIDVSWNGLLGGHYSQASTVFMRATVQMTQAAGGQSFDFDLPAVAIVPTAVSNGEVEVGSEVDFSYATRGIGTVTAQEWDFEGKAFQLGQVEDVYDTYDLLQPAQLEGQDIETVYHTGSKTEEVPQTDLGPRRPSLTVWDRNNVEYFTSYGTNDGIEVMVHKYDSARAKLTGYQALYESQSNHYGSDGNYNISVIIGGTTYFFGFEFVDQLTLHPGEGTGRVFKLRTASNLGYNPQGYDPGAGQQFIEFNHMTGTPPNATYYFDFHASCPHVSQHAARFQTPSGHRSYYNASSYHVTEVTTTQDLQAWANAAISGHSWTHDAPVTFDSNAVTIDDKGPFDKELRVGVDEKHIDIFYSSSGSNGIDPDDLDTIISTHYGTVRK